MTAATDRAGDSTSPPDWASIPATGIGSLPGGSADEAARTVAGELPDLPHLVELPTRGVGADMIGRTIGLLVDVYAEVVPSGWRVTRRPSRDTRRAQDFLNWDFDAAQAHYAGADWVKIQVCGPWTLAAGLELSSGNRALIDAGAVDDLADSLAEGIRAQLAELRRRLPGSAVVVQVDEPGLPSVLRGSVPTASGFGTVSAVDPARALEVLARLVAAAPDAPWVAHCCDPDAPLAMFGAAGFTGLSFDVTRLGTRAARLDPVGEAMEADAVLLAGLVYVVPDERPLRAIAAPLLDIWNRLGLPRAALARVLVTPTCGLAGADPDWATRAMARCTELGRALLDPPEGW